MATAVSVQTSNAVAPTAHAGGADAHGIDANAQLGASLQDGKLEVPLLSRTAGEVIALCGADDADARSLALLIQQDPALAAEVLRIANSASFAGGAAVVSLQQAIARMGLGRVREIALAIALKSDLFRSRAHEGHLRTVWRDAVATAAWAREVARACRVNAEMAYLGGLLHNIGVPVLLRNIERLGLVFDADGLAQAIHDHTRLAGVTLVQRWTLPAQVAAVIEDGGAGVADDPTVRIVAAAIWLAHVDTNESDEGLVGSQHLQRINLYPEDVQRLWRNREKVTAMVEALAL